MAPTKVILLSCGSYNPPTNMHLRMFEIARDHLHKMGTHVVVGGVISPVHDAYGKKELVSATHRCAMLRLALQNNDWIRLSDWETKREEWTKTKVTIQHHQNLLNSWIFDTNDVKHHSEIEDMDWIPDKIKNSSATEQTPIQVKLLCGADLLESFGTPGLWAEEDIDAIVGQHGLVVVTREGSNPNKFIYDSDLLSKYIHNILIVTEWITNEISSTKIRRALRRGESVRYLLHDSVLDYVYKHEIYNARGTAGIKLGLSTNNAHNNYLNVDSKYDNAFLTPSPSDITMETPSPVEIISIDIPDSLLLKKNLLNSSPFGSSSKFPIGKVDDNDLMREKFIGVMSENGNKLLNNMKSVYPGQAKQIIATETGESHILDEVGSISDRNIPLTIQNDCDNKSLNPLDKDYALINLDSKDSELIEDKKNFLELNCENPENASSPLNYPSAKISCDSESVNVNDLYKISENPVDEKESGKTRDPFLSKEQDVEDQKVPEKENSIEETAITEENLINNLIPDETKTEEQIEGSSVNKEALEIDGKYLKSLVNSRKSPKKCKTKNEKTTCKEEPPIIASEVLAFCEIPVSEIAKTDSLRDKEESKMKEDGFTQCDKIDSVNSESQTDLNFVTDEKSARLGSRRTSKAILRASESAAKPFIIQGSLDSVKFSLPMEKSGLISGLDSAAKKSKSFESIKYDSSRSISYKSFEISYSDTLKPKSDSTSRLVTANFCTECCYANDSFLPDASLNHQETFYTVQSNRSSPVEEDSTECDICSACNLDSTEILDSKSLNIQQEKCDLCEICGDLNADFEGDLVMPYADSELRYNSVIGDDSVVTLFPDGEESDNERFEIENCGLEAEASVKNYEEREGEDSFDQCVNIEDDNDDDFEIENCGLDNNVKNIARESSKLRLQLVQKNQSDGRMMRGGFLCNEDTAMIEDWRSKNIGGVYSSNDNFNKNTAKFSLAKFLPNGSRRERKIVRKGSFIISESSPKLFQDKRRYSSVDNLQQPKQIVKLSERGFQRSRSSKLVASADNIQSTNTHARSGRLKKLQKSVNDIDTLAENLANSTDGGKYTLSENDLARSNEGSNIRANIKIRDSDMVKMILTKHGIKIISEKETAL